MGRKGDISALPLKQMLTRKSLVITAFAVMAVGYIVLPTHLGLSEDATDLLAAALLPLAICIWTYEDHRDERSLAQLSGVLSAALLASFSVGLAVLLSDAGFRALILINAVLGGILYWYIDKHIPVRSD
jgi:hypothetical protein